MDVVANRFNSLISDIVVRCCCSFLLYLCGLILIDRAIFISIGFFFVDHHVHIKYILIYCRAIRSLEDNQRYIFKCELKRQKLAANFFAGTSSAPPKNRSAVLFASSVLMHHQNFKRIFNDYTLNTINHERTML